MGKFLIKKVPTGFKFDLKAANGETVATSEVYTSKAACIKGAQGVISVAEKAPCADLTQGEMATNPKFELFQDKARHFRFRLLARNGKIIAASESYMTRYACLHGIESVRVSASDATVEDCL